MQTFLLELGEVSLTASAVGLVLVMLSPLLNKRFPLYWKRWAWLVLALRLLLPVSISLPAAPVHIEVPPVSAARPSPGITPGVMAPDVAGGAGMADLPMQQNEVDLAFVLVCIWLGVSLVLFLRGMASYALFRKRALRWSLPATADTQAVYSAVSRAAGVRRAPPLRISKRADSPMLAGVLRPVVLLPHESYNKNDLAMIFCHELVHYKRGDTWLKLVLHAAKSLHWFNPGVYFITRQAQRDIELACDERVVRIAGGANRRSYGSLILESAAGPCRYPAALTTGFQPGKRLLKERITNIMQKNKKRGGVVLLSIAAAVTLLCGLLVAFTPLADTQDPEKQTPDSTNDGYVEREYGPLLALRPDGYRDMTVAAFREEVFRRIEANEEEVHALMDRYDETLVNTRYTDADSSFILNTLVPLTAENWKLRTYYGGWQTEGSTLEIWLTRDIMDAEALTVGEYEDGVLGALAAADEWARGADAATLLDQAALDWGMKEIAARYSNDKLDMDIGSWYVDDGHETGSGADNQNEPYGEATAEDYARLLALRYEGYEDMSVLEYKTGVQEAFNADGGALNDAYERVYFDVIGDEMPASLTDEEKSFIAFTLETTVAQFVAEHQSQYSNTTKKPSLMIMHYGEDTTYEIIVDLGIEFDIQSQETLTIRERDTILSGMTASVNAYLDMALPSDWARGEEAFLDDITANCEKFNGPAILFKPVLYSYGYTPPLAEYYNDIESMIPEFVYHYTAQQLAQRDYTALDPGDEACFADLFTQVAAAYNDGTLPLADNGFYDTMYTQEAPEGAVFPAGPVRYSDLTVLNNTPERLGIAFSLPLGNGHEMILTIRAVDEENTAQYVANIEFV